MTDFLLLILGLLGLWVGTEILLKGALGFSERFNVSDFFVGLTIVALGTDIPELIVGLSSSIKATQGIETSGLVIGSVVGSAIAQVSLILGVTGLFGYLTIPSRIFYRDGSMLLGSMLVLVILAWDGDLTRWESAFYFGLYFIYFAIVVKNEYEKEEPSESGGSLNTLLCILYLVGGAGVVYLTSELVVVKSLLLSEVWNISQTFLGVVIVSLGTSLPELVVSLNALRKKAARLSIGNIIGSNIFDMVFVLGLCSTISPLKIPQRFLLFEIPALFILTSMALTFLFLFKRGLQKREAWILIGCYLCFLGLKFFGAFSLLADSHIKPNF